MRATHVCVSVCYTCVCECVLHMCVCVCVCVCECVWVAGERVLQKWEYGLEGYTHATGQHSQQREFPPRSRTTFRTP